MMEATPLRGAFKTQLNNLDGAFCENSQQLHLTLTCLLGSTYFSYNIFGMDVPRFMHDQVTE